MVLPTFTASCLNIMLNSVESAAPCNVDLKQAPTCAAILYSWLTKYIKMYTLRNALLSPQQWPSRFLQVLFVCSSLCMRTQLETKNQPTLHVKKNAYSKMMATVEAQKYYKQRKESMGHSVVL